MKNKTATECWNMLRSELDSAIDRYVPMGKQGKRPRKTHLSNEAVRKYLGVTMNANMKVSEQCRCVRLRLTRFLG